MSAYATARSGRALSSITSPDWLSPTGESSVLDAVIEDLAERVAAAVVSRLGATKEQEAGEWLDSRGAAEYLGVHRDTLRKLAAEQTIPSHQDGPGCKLFFRRPDLDEWRRSGVASVTSHQSFRTLREVARWQTILLSLDVFGSRQHLSSR